MKKTIAVCFGGMSVEHEVSVVSGLQAIQNLNPAKYNIAPLYITKDSQWYTGEVLLDIDNYKDIPALLARADKVYLSSNTGESCFHFVDRRVKSPLDFNESKTKQHIDVVIPVNHGTNVEDGILQGVFENAGIPYAGSNVIASAVGMDKILMKHVFRSMELDTLDWVWFHKQEWIEDERSVHQEIKAKISFPCIIKPAIAGSSIGVKKADDEDELYEAIEVASKFCPKIIAEKYLHNMTEINCSVLGNSFQQKASVCERPLGASEILDFEAKYIRENNTGGAKSAWAKSGGGMSQMDREIPADISEKLTERIQKMAKDAFRELYCSGVARIDFMIDNDTGIVYINELNGIPGSLSYYLWEMSGLTYPQLLDELILIALENHRIKQDTIYSIDTNLLSLQSGSGSKSSGKLKASS
jgi:D-alanine-D-alanine ligase